MSLRSSSLLISERTDDNGGHVDELGVDLERPRNRNQLGLDAMARGPKIHERLGEPKNKGLALHHI